MENMIIKRQQNFRSVFYRVVFFKIQNDSILFQAEHVLASVLIILCLWFLPIGQRLNIYSAEFACGAC